MKIYVEFTHLFGFCLNITTKMMNIVTKTMTTEAEMMLMIRDAVDKLLISSILVLSTLLIQLMLMSIEAFMLLK